MSTDTLHNDVITTTVAGNPTLLDVLNAPQTYGGEAFNAVATYLSIEAGLDVQFDELGNPIHFCPLEQSASTSFAVTSAAGTMDGFYTVTATAATASVTFTIQPPKGQVAVNAALGGLSAACGTSFTVK